MITGHGSPATDAGAEAPAQVYSTRRRTALILTGTGTAGAYHAGALRALHEAGIKIDLVHSFPTRRSSDDRKSVV